MLFEVEIPLNFQLEKLTDKFTAITCLDEYLGFHFNNGANHCNEFNKLLTQLYTKLKADKAKRDIFKDMADQIKQNIQQKRMELSANIDMNLIIKGTGDAAHKHEINKLITSAGMQAEDLKKPEIVGMLKEVMTDYIVDEEIKKKEAELQA